jgi:hypothetical protein
MSGEEQAGEENEPWLSPEEIVDREYQVKRREYDELQRLMEELFRKAEADFQAAHPWLAPDMCVSVPVRLLRIDDPKF